MNLFRVASIWLLAGTVVQAAVIRGGNARTEAIKTTESQGAERHNLRKLARGQGPGRYGRGSRDWWPGAYNPSSTECQWDLDCAWNYGYCSQGVCRPHGQCVSDLDCINPSNKYKTARCIGQATCADDGYCYRSCGQVACKDGSPQTNCSVSPCQNPPSSTCLEERPTWCVVDYCSESCDATFINAAGFEVCKSSSNGGPSPTPPSSVTCQSDSDCTTDEYCQGGSCAVKGSCSSITDCFNPSNQYPDILCIGPVTCEEGQCGRTCGGTFCADGSEPVNCFERPCDVISVDCRAQAVSCVDDYCGGCNAHVFDAAGNLCTGDSNPGQGTSYTPEECEAVGVIVFDIGDGSSHSPDYLCASSGKPILGTVQFDPSGPIPDEGAVCCGSADSFTPEECEAVGVITYDVGDGSSYSPDFLCATNGKPILGVVRFDPSGQIPDEGAVCCGPADPYTPEGCEAAGGVITYDIGDGSSRRPGYLCESNGFPPLGIIEYPDDGPRPREGAVCCGGPIITYTPEECEAVSGVLTYDIGDGSIHRPSYLCETNGKRPLGSIQFDPSGPIPIEGAVCCGSKEYSGSGGLCSSDGNCREEEYCQQGTCQAYGSCSTDVDCFNPSNIYPLIACVGHVSCRDGTCGKSCGATNCADDALPFNCKVSPCEFLDADCESQQPVSCVADYCGGCNAIRFDAGGNQVCKAN